MNVNSSTLSLLSDLIDEIHDSEFCLSEVMFNRETGEWKLYLRKAKKEPFCNLLRITGVREYTYSKDQGIEIYMIDELIIDLDKETIVLETCQYLTLTLAVNPDFEIYLE
jgi:hypothetical protein